MDLKSGHPFWPIKNGLLGHYFPLKQDVNCEVAILGAGITGALVAYYLTREGIPTIIVDRREGRNRKYQCDHRSTSVRSGYPAL